MTALSEPPGRAGQQSGFSWTDSHCHLQYAAEGPERREAIERALAAGVFTMICVGTDEESSRASLEIAAGKAPGAEIYATAGLHPHDASSGADAIARLVAAEVAEEDSRLVAVGECGLDYHYDYSPRAAQREAFAAQVALANEHGLALVIHTREAFDDTLAVLKSEGVPERTIFHCFTGGPEDAERCLDTGGYLSFSGIVTFKNAEDVRAASRLCPLDRLLIETDSPFLAPVPRRGDTNEPSLVVLVGEELSRQRDLPLGEVAELTSKNASVAFALPRS